MGSIASLALSVVALAGGDAPGANAVASPRVETLGHSVRGRPIRAFVVGERDARRRVLVVGCIHGNECAGVAVTRRLVRGRVPADTALWIIHNVNPDGAALGVRQNARGVDLNRNFGSEWRPIGRRWDPQYSGPRPWSEPETRLVRRLVVRVRPGVTLWFHQPQALVRAWGGSVRTARRYARLARVPYRSIRWPAGTAPNWQNHRFRGAASFVVELPAGRLSARAAARYAGAVRALASRP
jgi:murein peptide amidase A